MSKAILLTGQLRFTDDDHFDKFLTQIVDLNIPIFICTYKSFQNYAEKLTSVDKICYYEDFSNHYKKCENHIYQWIHLDILLKKFRVLLNEFDVLYKIRTDIIFSNEIFQDSVEDNCIYLHRDIMFYGKSHHFIKTFENYYNDIYTIYYDNTWNYIPLNYENIMKLENTRGIHRFHWINFPEIIWDHNFSVLKQNIQKYIFDEKINPNECKVKVNVKIGRKFSSEKSFVINCINHGLIKPIKGRVELTGKKR